MKWNAMQCNGMEWNAMQWNHGIMDCHGIMESWNVMELDLHNLHGLDKQCQKTAL
jgi:hypothetical protein